MFKNIMAVTVMGASLVILAMGVVHAQSPTTTTSPSPTPTTTTTPEGAPQTGYGPVSR